MVRVQYHAVSLRCAPHMAYAMFTLNEHLEKWLAAEANVEPKHGGKYELFWNPPERETDSNIDCAITVFEPDTALGFRMEGTAGAPRCHEQRRSLDPRVRLLPARREGRRSVDRHPYDSLRLAEHVRLGRPRPWEFFQNAWKMVFARLQQLVNTGVVPPPWPRRPRGESF